MIANTLISTYEQAYHNQELAKKTSNQLLSKDVTDKVPNLPIWMNWLWYIPCYVFDFSSYQTQGL